MYHKALRVLDQLAALLPVAVSSSGSHMHFPPPLNHALTVSRLQSELMSLMTSPTPGISAFPASATDMTQWNATVIGPSGTPYESLTFKLTMTFPSTYPLAPPEVLFKTPIYHPNVDMAGRICLDILKPGGAGKEGAWSAALNVSSILLSIQSLLGEPNK